MNIGDNIYFYEIRVKAKGNVEKSKEEHKVLGVNEEYLCLDNNSFQTLQFKKDKDYNIYTPFDYVNVYENKWRSSVLEDEIVGYLYTSEPDEIKAYKSIKKGIEKYIKKEYCKYGNYLDIINKLNL